MTRVTRATLVFPRTGQVIKVDVPVEQYEAVIRRNKERIGALSPGYQAARRFPSPETIEKISAPSV